MDTDFPPSKRRKRSITESISVGASTTSNGHIRQNAVRSPTERFSYMSPTKASLSRFHPSLLPRSESAEPRRPRSSGKQSITRRALTVEDAMIDANGGLPGVLDARATWSGNTANGGPLSHGSDTSPNIQDTPSKLPQPKIARGNTGTIQNHNSVKTPIRADKHAHERANGQAAEDEPILPSTPSQLGLEPPPEKPRGLLFHSPSRKHAPLRRQTKPSTTLNPGDHDPQSVMALHVQTASMLGARVFIDSAPQPGSTSQQFVTVGHQVSLHQLKARLLALQHEITIKSMQSLWWKDNTKLGKFLMKKRQDVGKHSRRILKIQVDNRREAPEGLAQLGLEAGHVDHTAKTRSIISRLAQFGPFSEKRLSLTPKNALNFNSEDTPPAVRIPYSSIAPEYTDNHLVHQDVELITSNNKTMLKFQLSIDPVSQTLKSLDVLNAAAWVEGDLSPWLQKLPNDKPLAFFSATIGRYIEVSRKRAGCWSQCNTKLTDLVATELNTKSDSAALGLSSMQLSRSPVVMPIEWHIDINDKGEVESRISCKCSFPKEWRQLDTRADLNRVDEIFHSLVTERGVMEAIRIMAKTLFPT